MSDDVAPMLRDAAAGFLREHHSLGRLRALRDRPDGLDREVLGAMADQGWLGLRLPEALGGAGLGLRAAVILAEQFGRALLPEPFVQVALMPSVVVAAAPGSPLRDRVAQWVCGGRHVVALATAEGANELDPTAPGAAVELRGNRALLNGTKLFAYGAADTWLVSARLNGRVALVAVERSMAGLQVVPQRMVDGTLTVTLRLDDVAVPDGAILLADASGALCRARDEATVATSAQLAGLGAAALEATLHYMGQREQFGRPIGSFQALQHRAVDLRLQLELAGAGWRNALRRYEAAPDGAATGAATGAAISAAKARCADAALATCRAAIQFHGAIGYTDDADIGLYMKSAMRLASFAGNGTAHRHRFFELQMQDRP